jgi:L-ascorbate metabolism protein UlaG (beta-lactamase superfamily)
MPYNIPEAFRPPASAVPPGAALTIEWFGTAGFRIVWRDSVLLIDPFVTRPRILRIGLLRVPVNEALCAEVFPRAENILLGHSHYDHLQDVPAIARRTGATVHGSASTAAVCRAAGIDAARTHVIAVRDPFACGPFRVTFVPSLHGKALMCRVPSPGVIEDSPRLPMRAMQYRHGGTFGLLVEAGAFRMYHCGSADLIEEEIARVGPVDVLLLGLAGRKHTPHYLERLAGPLKPRWIVPHHYDNFFRPLRSPMKLLPGIHLEQFFEEARTVCPDARILMPAMFESVAFDPEKRELMG